ncbi:MAG TPA: penicillin-binding protein activator [Devosiaceae bacterium]|jgi:hypothetical protein
MAAKRLRLKQLRGIAGLVLAAPLLAQCTMGDFDSLREIRAPMTVNQQGEPVPVNGQMTGQMTGRMPGQVYEQPLPAAGGANIYSAPVRAAGQAQGESFGSGPVKVALLLPLSGDQGLGAVGMSMANGARLAVDYIAANANIADNITVTLHDTGGSAGQAAQEASAAIGAGASIILGPLRADEVTAVGSVARAAGVPVIAFSNNPDAAGPGVYLLSVLPGGEVRRGLGYAKAQGHRAVAALFPTSAYGQVEQAAFTQAMGGLGLTPQAVNSFGSDAEMQRLVGKLAPRLKSGAIDTLFLPDRASAPRIAAALEAAGVSTQHLLIVGSADWQGDGAILAAPLLDGAVYPAVDPAGLDAIRPAYGARFGGSPHPLTTLAYTATILANTSLLSKATPQYDRGKLTGPAGFNGRDGLFRFHPDGQSDYALVMEKVTPGGAVTVDGAKL